ncbi:MAG: LPS export ABC transporter permease LptF [Candidatus Binatia bacterium]|nr:LPS export ABC transporter permease LptF [Candidatus Binatia bacterium]
MPKMLSRYLVSEILPPFLFGLAAFTFILFIARLLRLIELVVARGVPILQIGKVLSLILPTFLEMTLPMAFLLAILLGLGRLSNDQELLAMKASGVGPHQILGPIAMVAIVVAVITLSVTMFARPAANFALKKELYHIAKSRIGTALKEKVFNDDFPKILIYVEELIPPGDTAQGVLIVDKRAPAREQIILGRVAQITTDEESNTLRFKLFDGTVYEKEKNRLGFSQTRYNTYDFRLDLDEMTGSIKRRKPGPKEMSFRHLARTIRQKLDEGTSAIPERVELQQRLSFGFIPLVFCLLGVALALLPRSTRANRSWGLMLSFFWLLVYYVVLSFGKALGDKGLLHPVPALWLPNILVGGVAVYFYCKAVRESPISLPTRMEQAWGTARRYLASIKRTRNA